MFLRVLLAFNCLCALNPITTVLLSVAMNNVPDEVANFWLLATLGMFVFKVPLAHVCSLHLAWMNFPTYLKHSVRSPSNSGKNSRCKCIAGHIPS